MPLSNNSNVGSEKPGQAQEDRVGLLLSQQEKKEAEQWAVNSKFWICFSGIGGFSLGLEATGGFETVAFCEQDPFCQKVLAKHWPDVPIFDEVRTLEYDGPVDIVCGGFPCQDASIANQTGVGADGERTGLFVEAIRHAREMGAKRILLENVPELLNRGFGRVLGALAESGFDVEWDCISSSALGAAHKRARLFIHAYASGEGRQGFVENNSLFVTAFASLPEHGNDIADGWEEMVGSEHVLCGSDGLSVSMERRRLSQYGNAVDPRIVKRIGAAILSTIQQKD